MDEETPTPAEEQHPTGLKADLIHYAISHGEDRDTAVNMHMDELVARYGDALAGEADALEDEIQPLEHPAELVCPICGLPAGTCHHNLPAVPREH